MPSYRFLPRPINESGYPIVVPTEPRFVDAQLDVMQSIGVNMDVQHSATEGRIPSPISRAYMFYSNLFYKSFRSTVLGASDNEEDAPLALSRGRTALHLEARDTFRGMLAVFCLRDSLGLELRVKKVPLPRNDRSNGDSLVAELTQELETAPGGRAFWDPIRLLQIRPLGTRRWETFGGLSPLTAFFPAARAPKYITGLYWYDPKRGKWDDPCGAQAVQYVDKTTVQRVAHIIHVWLSKVLESWHAEELKSVGIAASNASALRRELEAWQQELVGSVRPSEPISIVHSNLSGDDERAAPFLKATFQGDRGTICSSCPWRAERLVVTEHDLLRDSTRIHGRVRGDYRFQDAIQRMPPVGPNLGEALGLEDTAVPVPYVLLDGLFESKLCVVTDSVADRWQAMKVDLAGRTEYALFPFKVEILKYVDPSRLVEAEAHSDTSGRSVIVDLKIDSDRSISRKYERGEGRFTLDSVVAKDTFDIRVFPDFDIDTVKQHLPVASNGRTVDGAYYARVRLLPDWDFSIRPFDFELRELSDPLIMGTEEVPAGATFAPGRAAFFEIPNPRKPRGFVVSERGFCLLRLRDAEMRGVTSARWTIGVDFGTSNTCVSLKKSEEGQPEVMKFPVLTTSFLLRPKVNVSIGRVSEGASALLDFFNLPLSDENATLSTGEHQNPGGFFPSQIITQQTHLEQKSDFQIADGLIYFKNPSLAITNELALIEGYPHFDKYWAGERYAKKFRLKTNIKWQEKEWLKVFLYHIRKLTNLTAAQAGGRIAEVRFSYPKSFGSTLKTRLLADFRNVWEVDGPNAPLVAAPISESEAAQSQVVGQGEEAFVIVDIGGGTSDITGFYSRRPKFQTSFRLAAGQINRYVIASPLFRTRFLNAVKSVDKYVYDRFDQELLDAFCGPVDGVGTKSGTTQIELLWLALLQELDDRGHTDEVFNDVRITDGQDPLTKAAVQGFFLTIALVVGGLSFFSGCLLQAAALGAFASGAAPFKPSMVRLDFAGNGSKVYRFLEHPDVARFNSVVEMLFRSGLTAARFSPEQAASASLLGALESAKVEFRGLMAQPKAIVCLGLLRSEGRTGGADQIPVANVIGELDVAPRSSSTEGFGHASVAFFRQLAGRRDTFHAPDRPAELLGTFLHAFAKALPHGMNDSHPVVPALGPNWQDWIEKEFYPDARTHIRRRMLKSADKALKEDKGRDEDVVALEPVFISELAGLLDSIRLRFADDPQTVYQDINHLVDEV